MKYIIALLGFMTFTIQAQVVFKAGPSRAFTMAKDALCFKNATQVIEDYGPLGLGTLGKKEGICQGIAGVTAAFVENAVFSPSNKKLSADENADLIERAIQLHSGGCKKRFTVPGYKNMQEFCSANLSEIVFQATMYNADIATYEIGTYNLTSFLFYQDNLLTSHGARVLLHNNILSLKERLEEGRAPLMLVYKHVTMVTGLRYKIENGKLSYIAIDHYDSNHPEKLSVHYILYGTDGLPKTGKNRMLWDITPDRTMVFCSLI